MHVCAYIQALGFGSHISRDLNIMILLNSKDILKNLQTFNKVA